MSESIHPAPEQGVMEALQLAGRIIIENGGETYRAEETICRMGQGIGLTEVESFAVPSGLFISYRGHDGLLESGVKRVHRQGTNLTKIDQVNAVSRKVTAGQMSIQQAWEELRRIDASRGPVASGWMILAAFLCAGGFALLFGGGEWEILFAGLVAAVVQLVGLVNQKMHMQWLVTAIFGGFLTSLLPHFIIRLFPGVSQEILIAGAVMPLVPGLAMTNAVQDTMRGDMVSGLSHGTQALLTACLVAGGALLSNALVRLLEGGLLG
ncbi:MAG: threonine/serine exporter family protein [Clostridia bacterium]|nr:threonine/serine exporter family protein [Clostridia bacterium]